MDFDEFV